MFLSEEFVMKNLETILDALCQAIQTEKALNAFWREHGGDLSDNMDFLFEDGDKE